MSTVTQEDTVAMFDKITSVMDYLRNQLVNNTELAKQVQTLQQQVNEMTGQVNSVVGQNTALQEAINALTHERDELRSTNVQLIQERDAANEKFTTRDNDANHWYAEFQRVSAELDSKRAELGRLEDEHLRLVDEHDKAQDKLKHIQSVFGAAAAMEQENHPVPIVEEVHKPVGPQPRDPVTQQWRSWNTETMQWEDQEGNKVA